ncbi:MAG: SpoIIE family protein phosphatase [Xenococcaceae cyanobacterium MO_167.B27]|nr:SpoIIE family protein phosphatase [Xenococcaceae cyanobacterium MO_167.B27]
MQLSKVKKNPVILVADDEQSTRVLLSLILQEENYQIIEATNGVDCINKYQENQPDMVLLDAMMPVMDGFTCCQKLMEIQAQESNFSDFYQVPILMITGLNDQKSVNRAFEVGATDYVTKPIQPSVLCRRLRHLLEAKWAEAAVRESEQKYRIVVNNLKEGIFQLDPQGKLTFLNLAWQNIVGFSIEESLGKSLSEFIYSEDRITYESALKSLLNQQETELCLSIRYLKPDQGIGWMEIDARPIICDRKATKTSQEQQIIGISGTINDITERKRRQAHQKVEYKINKLLADATQLEKTISIILSILCKNLGWDLGEYWSLDINNKSLKLSTYWHSSAYKIQDFVNYTEQSNLNLGEDLPGKAWEYDRSLLIKNITKNSKFSHTKLATKASLKTAFGFLVCNGSEKLGVIFLFCREKKQVDSGLINLVRTIGIQIGQFIKRQQAEEQLQKQHLILKSELNQAARYISSLLPNPQLINTIDIQQLFIPSTQLGGDIFDYYWLDPENLAIYLLDVAGHGVRPALLSVSIRNLLRSQSLNNTDFYQPRTVISELNRMFPMDERGENYFTIWYGVYNLKEQKLSYCSAAHPPALLLNQNCHGYSVQKLANENIAVGMLAEFEFEEAVCSVTPGSSLYLFSDGVYEIPLSADKIWGFQAFVDYIQAHHPKKIDKIDTILDHVQKLNSAATLSDDFSLIRFNFL